MEILIEPPDSMKDEQPLKVVLKYRRPGHKVFGRRVAARLKLTVSEDCVLVTAPGKMSLKTIHEFVLENWEWVASQRKKLAARTPIRVFAPGAMVRIYGVLRRLVVEDRTTGSLLESAIPDAAITTSKGAHATEDESFAAHIRFELVGEVLLARVSSDTFRRLAESPFGFEASYARALRRFAEAEARLHLEDRVRYWSARMGLQPTGLSFRRQKTRWGSCSSEGHLSLNWKLVFAPEAVIDYVVIHEIAHLKHQNHSAQFWGLVEQYDPQAQSHRRWLRIHQNETRWFDF